MKIKFYGTRGSIPVTEPEYQVFGGNTSCVAVGYDGGIGIFDAGTGIRNLGKDLFEREKEKYENIFLAFSHFHWDHIQGFPFFLPAYDSERQLTITAIGITRDFFDLKSILENQMREEFFPVPLGSMGAKLKYVQDESELKIDEGVKIISTNHYHPGGASSYRVEAEGKSVVYTTDVEHGDSIDNRVVEIAQNADILIHEAQYTPEELKNKKGWGHSSWEQAIKVAKLANVKQLILTHHDPEHNDEFLAKVERECQDHFPNVMLAKDNMEIEL